MNAMLRLILGQAVLALVLVATTVSAQTVLIDFGSDTSFRGLSVVNPDANGNNWNNIAPGAFFSDLIDTNGVATTIDFGFSTPVGTDSYNGPAGDTSAGAAASVGNTDIDAAALGDLGVLNAAFDFVAERDTRFEIQGLDPSKQYDLTFFGSHKYSGNATTLYSVYTDNTYSTVVGSATLDIQDLVDPSLHNRDTVATISGLSPQTGDILYVQFTGTNGDYGYLNSLKITAVPEPASAVVAIGLVGIAAASRRCRV
ncbi:hypothetical protein Pla108_40020 [Botrimarina colliarenosi]|uniref:PEP-CTERM protein-sorting domain-containing protein n=1 Tax=Botrimarina colliarenosi TaxID=2528001 RepID=A0A5C5ZZ58_9BACT|nr:hypothetical protein [Botrimarina colliarenosi]TWT92862.1 hypothetical protein Pla108_40020 [Botrimarina colliarenosi]